MPIIRAITQVQLDKRGTHIRIKEDTVEKRKWELTSLLYMGTCQTQEKDKNGSKAKAGIWKERKKVVIEVYFFNLFLPILERIKNQNER